MVDKSILTAFLLIDTQYGYDNYILVTSIYKASTRATI